MRDATVRGTATERLAPEAAQPVGAGRGPAYRVLVLGSVAEVRRLSAVPLAGMRRGPAAFPLALGATGLVLLTWLAQLTPLGLRVVNYLGGEAATLPVPAALLRLPGSLFAPAPSLPVWGALAQVLVAFGLAEVLVGRGRTIAVALAATAAATASGRLMRLLGPHSWIGLSHHATAVRDTGPSAAVVALLVYLCWVCRAPRAFVLVVGTMLGEIAIKPNLAGREHLVAIAVGVLAGLVLRPRAAGGLDPLGALAAMWSRLGGLGAGLRAAASQVCRGAFRWSGVEAPSRVLVSSARPNPPRNVAVTVPAARSVARWPGVASPLARANGQSPPHRASPPVTFGLPPGGGRQASGS